MIQAYATLFAWKLSLHGVDAASTHQYVTSRWFQAINGHRDAAATLCPGQYLYDKIPEIRTLAAAAQRGWSGRQLESNLASTPAPGPRRAPGLRRRGLRDPDRRADPLPAHRRPPPPAPRAPTGAVITPRPHR